MITQHDAAIEAVARKLYETSCALDPVEPREPNWGRDGYKTEVIYWRGLALAGLSATPAPSDEVVRLREALIAAGRNSGALLTDDVSTDFLMLIPAEVEARIARLREDLAWYGEQARLARLIHSEGDAGRNALASDGGKRARAALGPEVGEG